MMTLLLLWFFAPQPDTLSLGQAQDAAWEHFPLARQVNLHEEIAELRRKEINVRLHPSFSAGGQATYHSAVPEIPLDAPGLELPSVKHDQYRVSLDVSQLIYDGGAAAGRRRLEDAASAVAGEQVLADFHRIREQVNQVYFAALLQDAALSTLLLLREDVEARMRALQARVKEGVAAAGTADVLEVDLLRIDQQLQEARDERSSAVAVLSKLTGLELSNDAVLLVPDVSADVPDAAPRRPEYAVFRATRERFDAQKRLAEAESRPVVSSSASLAYGRPPGLNIFENGFSPFYTLGLQVRWPLFRSARRDLRIIDLQREVLDTQEEAFTQSVSAAAERERHDVLRLGALMEQDLRIIALREKIAKRAGGQYEHGAISATEYLLEEHASHQARLTYERRRIELAFARVRYLTTLGLNDDTGEGN